MYNNDDNKYFSHFFINNSSFIIQLLLIFLIIFIINSIYVCYSYSDKFHVVKIEKTKIDTPHKKQAKDTFLATQLHNSIYSDIDYFKEETCININTPTSILSTNLYTMRDHDLDLGRVPKNFIEYPNIKTNIINLTNNSFVCETYQTYGYKTFYNTIYIKDDEIIDVGFNIHTGVENQTKHYDDTILIIDSLHKNTSPIAKLYDITTGNLLASLMYDDINNNYIDLDNVLVEGVGKNFISISKKYTNSCDNYFITLNNEGFELHSVWNYVESPNKEKYIQDEIANEGSLLTFNRRTENNKLLYDINDIASDNIIETIEINLNQIVS